MFILKSTFSTNSFNTTTHWQQTLFQFEEPVAVKKGINHLFHVVYSVSINFNLLNYIFQDSLIKGKISCYKNPEYLRSYIVVLDVFDRIYKYKVE